MVSRYEVDLARKNAENKYIFKKTVPENYRILMEKASIKYRPIRWLPLDLPKVQFDDINEFLQFWDTESINIVRKKPDGAEPWNKDVHPLAENSSYYIPRFKGLYFYSHDSQEEFLKRDSVWTERLYQHFIFKKITEQILDTFPFDKISKMYMWESVREIGPHRDETWFYNCPTEFRVMINDENENPTLYVADIEYGDINYIDINGLDTNSFCWSNGSQLHGSDFVGKRKHLIVINGIISYEKMVSLLDRSIEKYKNNLNYNLQMEG